MARTISMIISIVFHPLLMVTYVLLLLLAINPYSFGVSGIKPFMPFVLLVFFSTFFIPMLVILMMKALGMVETIDLKDRHDRIGPFIATMIFYGWLFINLLNNPAIPDLFTAFVLGATLSLTLTFMINMGYQLSVHGVGMGAMLAGIFKMAADPEYELWFFRMDGETWQLPVYYALIGGILIAGIVGTARLHVSNHTLQEWFTGMGVGVVCQLIAFAIIM